MKRIIRRKTMLILIIIVMGVLIVSCGSPAQPEEVPPPEQVEDTSRTTVFTREQLATYDGKDGQPAYVAIDGVVYDVTGVDAWEAGTHQGHEAGQELTEALFEESPHGDSVLENLRVVGMLEE